MIVRLIKLYWLPRFMVLWCAVAGVAVANTADQTVRVAYFTKDVPGIEPLSPAFDPDSYGVIAQIFDSLIYFDADGNIRPGLATAWRQLGPTLWEFELRQGVKFHNGEVFDGHSVKFTYSHVLDPKNRAGNYWILSTIKEVRVDENDPYLIRIETHKPDGMFLNRLHLFGSICPPNYIQRHGLSYFFSHPVGTGPFKFVSWEKGRSIRLEKYPGYWMPSVPKVAGVEFLIIPESQWVKALLEKQVDLVPNFSGSMTEALMRQAKGEVRFLKRLVLSGYWVMLRNQGALANARVRQALNYAVNKADLVRFGDSGNAVPMASLGKQGEFGAHGGLEPYRYDPQLAKSILQEEHVQGLKLKAIAADIAEPVARIIKTNLQSVGVEVDLQIVSRADWAKKVVGYKLMHGKPAPYDMAINLVDNPIYHLGFHAGLFLYSASPWALLNSNAYDRFFEQAMSEVNPNKQENLLKALDKYIHDQALMIFTTQRIITVALQKHLTVEKFSLNGHLDTQLLRTVEAASDEL